jgi:hypothetical protein
LIFKGRALFSSFLDFACKGVFMKKVIVFAAIFALIGAVAFAQATVGGSIRYDLSVDITAPQGGGGDTTFSQSALTSGTGFHIGYSSDSIDALLAFNSFAAASSPMGGVGIGDVAGDLDAIGTWKVNDLFSVTGAYSRLYNAVWGHIGFNGNSNYGVGTTVVGRHANLKIGIEKGYVGIYQQPTANGSKSPGFFAGYDYPISDTISAGVSFTGAPYDGATLGAPDFLFVGTLHGSAGFGPALVYLNVGLWGGYNELAETAGVTAGAPGSSNSGDEGLVLEGLIGVDYAISEQIVVGATFGIVQGLGANGAGGTIEVALNAPIGLAEGFSITPGVIFYNDLNGSSSVQFGASLGYSF